MKTIISLFAIILSLVQCNEWSLPLYLWESTSDSYYHTALLPKPPSYYFPSNVNYTRVLDEPMSFVIPIKDSKAVSHPLVSLKLYYSAERCDFQTTILSMRELNRHGGNYEYIITIGAIASTPGSGYTASRFVPLTVSYDDFMTDSVTAPLSFMDLNLLLPKTPTKRYREGMIAGFAARGNCGDWCQVSMSESYPSAGGADCAFACNLYGRKHTQCFNTGFDISSMSSKAVETFKYNMKLADAAILEYGDATVTPMSSGTSIHISFNYFCCYSMEDKATIESVLVAFDWPSINVTYDQPVWRIDSDASDVDHYSIIVLLDNESQQRMQTLMNSVEAAVRAAGIDIHIPRSEQEPYHSTLGVVSGPSFPSIAALQSVNEIVPPGQWSPEPITLGRPYIL